jgi:large subunit ribosomal protein L27
LQGRDHTIHASVPGYVKYYRNPALHPKRKYIGVVFERDNVLPQPHNAVRRRKLGMLAYQMATAESVEPTETSAEIPGEMSAYTPSQPPLEIEAPVPTNPAETPSQAEREKKTIRVRRKAGLVNINLYKGRHHEWRQSNWEIGRAGDRNKNWQKEMSLTRRQKFAALQARNANRPTRAQQKAAKKSTKKGKKAKKAK